MIKVRFTTKFKKQLNKTDRKIQKAFDNRLTLFLENSDNPTLNKHSLIGKFKGCQSININGDWRAIYSTDSDKEIIFEFIGTHSQLYR
jgi:addiction module RelE/StbE family toxin